MGALIAGSTNNVTPVMNPKNDFNTKPVDISLTVTRSFDCLCKSLERERRAGFLCSLPFPTSRPLPEEAHTNSHVLHRTGRPVCSRGHNGRALEHRAPVTTYLRFDLQALDTARNVWALGGFQ